MKKWIISVAAVAVVCLLLGGLCYAELGSWNVIRVGLALSNVMSGNGVYQIAEQPEKIWLSHSETDFQAYLEEQGYVLVLEDRTDDRIPVEKDGVRDYVSLTDNAVYCKWTWQTAGEPAQGVGEQPATLYEPETAARYVYLYPETAGQITVRHGQSGAVSFTYPACADEWQLTAQPDGLLTVGGSTVYALYREGTEDSGWQMEEGFCVAGEDTVSFLEDAADRLGLTPRETQDLILTFAPKMAGNAWNRITIHVHETGLDITPAPDTVIGIFLIWQPVQESMDIPPQTLTAPRRKGFTVVELGGGEIE